MKNVRPLLIGTALFASACAMHNSEIVRRFTKLVNETPAETTVTNYGQLKIYAPEKGYGPEVELADGNTVLRASEHEHGFFRIIRDEYFTPEEKSKLKFDGWRMVYTFDQNTGTMSQRVVDLSKSAKEGCVTEYGTMRSSNDGDRVEFGKGDTSIGFEKSGRVFRLFTAEYFTPEEREQNRADGRITRYITTYPNDHVGLKIELPLNPKYSLRDLVLGDSRSQEAKWTTEYEDHMKALLDALEKCK